MAFRKTWNKSVKDGLKSFFVILLLISYVAGNIQFKGFHQLFHDHENIVAHSAEQEGNPCHLSIYHHDKSGGCRHEFHLVKVDKCTLCHILSHPDQLVVSNCGAKFIQPACIFTNNLIPVHSAGIDTFSLSRAPPAA